MSILNHPDYESCIKPWCAAVAAGKEPPQVEFGDAQHVWTLVEVPVWYNERRYRLVPRKIMIGKREVNAPVDHATEWVLRMRDDRLDFRPSIYFANFNDCIDATDAIIALLKGDDTVEPAK